MDISIKDRERLRKLAAQQAELSHSDRIQTLRREWKALANRSKDARPMFRMGIAGIRSALIVPMMECEDETARTYEEHFLLNMFNHLYIGDDSIVPDHYSVFAHNEFLPFGVHAGTTALETHREDISEEEFERMVSQAESSIVYFDREITEQGYEEADSLFGDLLPVRYVTRPLHGDLSGYIRNAFPWNSILKLLGTNPKLVRRLYDKIAFDVIEYCKMMHYSDVLYPVSEDDTMERMSYRYVPDHPESSDQVYFKNWMYLRTPEIGSVAYDDFMKWIFPVYPKFAKRFRYVFFSSEDDTGRVLEEGIRQFGTLAKVVVTDDMDDERIDNLLRNRPFTVYRELDPDCMDLYGSDGALNDRIRAIRDAYTVPYYEIIQRSPYFYEGSLEDLADYARKIKAALE